MQNIFVLLLSADAVLREQWRGIDNAAYKFEQAQTLSQAQQWLAAYSGGLIMVDAALVDLADAQWQQLFANPAATVLVGSLNPSDPEGQKMIVAGAKGYFHAYSPVTVLDTMLQQVHAGNIWVGQRLLSRLLSQVSAKLSAAAPTPATAWQQGLTPREIEVAQRAALGHTNALIAEDLGITERTVRAHLSAVFEKLQVADRLMLALKVHGVG
ncbi:response regulator transcription factor [uncultured Paenalcaligenes sp.]|uniref:helix-turn-helix transcriptional regulator n=1 Tax=uncultured Paenalcaligenes sp. TaxID=1588925 RepID=UPI0026187898|nr:response regulator transcription factor [uncultured Paenalcaligenes sp.]